MATVVVVAVAVVAIPVARSAPAGPLTEPVRTWNEQALGTARAKSLSDAQAARLYAMVNAAMYDAVNGIVSEKDKKARREHALVASTGAPKNAVLEAAAASAAHAVLAGEFPDRIAVYDTQLHADLAALGTSKPVDVGRAWGAQVGTRVRAARSSDGSTPSESQPGVDAPGHFRASWSGVQFRNLAPFAVADSSVYVGDGPPPLDSLDYAGAFAHVKLVGNSAIADAEKLDTFRYWSLGTGTSQPPGAWIQVGLEIVENHPVDLHDATRLFALVTLSMVDTVAPTYMTKFTYHHWRPATAIQEAEKDGNPHTEPDPTWVPRAINIGTSPEYWSGHSSFSAAGAAALAGFFCADNIEFTLVTDSAPNGQTRTYHSLSAAAEEAGFSRVGGGIHFEFSNQEGLDAGGAVAAEVLADSLLLTEGPTHHGHCPL